MSEVTPISDWKKSTSAKPLELPSGKTCLARPAGVQAFLTAGLIPNSLMKIISQALAKPGQDAKDPNMPELLADLADNPEMLQDMLAMADSVTVYCVVEPAVYSVPTPNENGSPVSRNPDLLYVDEVDMDDKLFILNFAMGGSRDLEAFRQATAGGVGSLPAVQDVRDEPKPVTWSSE